jgi:alanine racemase
MERRPADATWAEVDLDAIRGNIAAILRLTGRAVFAVVKANAYGHGAVPVARAALEAGASWLAVARAGEALELRGAGIAAPLLILGWAPPAQLSRMIAEHVSLTVWEPAQLTAIAAAAREAGERAQLHLKVDTGMGRLGTEPEAGLDLARSIASLEELELQGVFTHFARADETDPEPTFTQNEIFASFIRQLTRMNLRPAWVHAANSAATIRAEPTWYDAVRVGVAMYGLHPSEQVRLPEAFRPALAWKSVVTQVKTLPVGRGLSYGHAYYTRGKERIGSVAVGYADGYRRIMGNDVLVDGKRCPVRGRVTMDQILIGLDGVPEVETGETVVLLGPSGRETITAEELGRRWGTINYEVTSGIAARVPRLHDGADTD